MQECFYFDQCTQIFINIRYEFTYTVSLISRRMVSIWVVPHRELPESLPVWRFLTERLLFPEMRSHRVAEGARLAELAGRSQAVDKTRIATDGSHQSIHQYRDADTGRIVALERAELARMESFIFHADKARAACSMLLQRAAVRDAMNCDDSNIRIERNSHVRIALDSMINLEVDTDNAAVHTGQTYTGQAACRWRYFLCIR
jgi:hypothetical protein